MSKRREIISEQPFRSVIVTLNSYLDEYEEL